MGIGIAAYLIAAAFMLRWNITAEDAAERATTLWAVVSKRLRQ